MNATEKQTKSNARFLFTRHVMRRNGTLQSRRIGTLQSRQQQSQRTKILWNSVFVGSAPSAKTPLASVQKHWAKVLANVPCAVPTCTSSAQESVTFIVLSVFPLSGQQSSETQHHLQLS